MNESPELEVCCWCAGSGEVPPTDPTEACFTCYGTGMIWSSMYVDDAKEKYGQFRLYVTTPALANLEVDYEPLGEALQNISDSIERRANHRA